VTRWRGWIVALMASVAASPAGAQAVRGDVRLGGAPLPDAVVFLERLGDTVAAPAPTRGRMDQRDLAFLPRILVVAPGSVVEFPNSDPVMHNVFHPGEGEDAFDLGTYPASEVKTLRFERAGLFVILCHVHPEMVGYVAVVPSALHATTAEDGSFRIEGAAPGRYRLHVWHRRVADPEMAVSVAPGGAAEPLAVAVERRGRRGRKP
jgi:plastocyanin